MEAENKKKLSLTLAQYIISIVVALFVGVLGAAIYFKSSNETNSENFEEYMTSDTELGPINEVYKILMTRYVDPLEKEQLIEGALAGMAAGTEDPYTEYLNEELSDSLNEDISGSFQGIGTEVTVEGQYVKVIAPISHSPAEKAGIQANDYILAVDGTQVSGMNLTEVVKLIRGKEGTTVTLTILRGEEQFDVDIKRAEIPIETVYVEKDKNHEGLAHVRITKFSENTAKDLTHQLKKLEKENIHSIVLDVRNNPGGVLTGALEVANIFIPDKKPIMQSEERNQKEPTTYYAGKEFGTYKFDGNVVLLVDEGSASASEILAGALQSIDIPIVGQTTYGKGTIQSIQPLALSKGELKITIGRWLTANGNQINKKGITPDEVVELDVPETMYGISPDKDYQLNDVGPEVENIKNVLKYLGYEVDRTNIFDQTTVNSVQNYQKENDLSVTGIIDTMTANSLNNAVREQMKINDQQYKAAVKKLFE